MLSPLSLPLQASPSKPKFGWWRAARFTATLLLVGMGLFWLAVLSVAGILYGWVVPHVDSLRPRIEAYASQQLGTQLTIGSITATSNGWRPTFDVQSVAADHLQLGRIQVSVSPLSLLHGALDQLVIDAPKLDVVRSKNGVISVAGFELKPTGGKPSPALDWLLAQREIVVRGGAIHWIDDMARPKTQGAPALPATLNLTDVQFTLQGGLRSHAIWLQAKPDKDVGKSIEFKGQFTQPLFSRVSQWQNWSGEAYMQLEKPQLSQFLLATVPSLATSLFSAGLSASAVRTFDNATRIALWADIDNSQLRSVSAKATQLPLLADEVTIRYDPLVQSGVLKGKGVLWTGVGAWSPKQNLPQDGHIDALTLNVTGWDGAKQWTALDAQARFSSSDVAGNVALKLQRSSSQLELNGTLSRVDLTALHRYLPLTVSDTTRQYARTAVQRGEAHGVQLAFKGQPKDLLTQLSVKGHLRDVTLAFAPQWPNLAQGRAQFEWLGTSLVVSKIEGKLEEVPVQGTVRLLDIGQPNLDIDLKSLKTPMDKALALVAQSPLQGLTQGFLAKAQGTGVIDITAQIAVPLSAPRQTKVTGQVVLQGNDLDLSASIPPLGKLRGQIGFTQAGLSVQNVRTQVLGGELVASGNLDRITAQGAATVAGLKQWQALPPSAAAALASASGGIAYQLQIQPLSQDGNWLRIESNLAGLELALPAPLDKSAQAVWPLVYEQRSLPAEGTHATLSIDGKLHAQLAIAKGAVQGRIAVGADVAQTPKAAWTSMPAGLSVGVQLPQLDLSAWQRILEPIWASAAAASSASSTSSLSALMPTDFSAYVQDLIVSDRHFEQVVVGASRAGSARSPVWRFNAQGTDFNGYGEYTVGNAAEQGSADQLYLRLAKLVIPDASSTSRIEQLLDSPRLSLPNLDVVVEDFELTGKKLGRLEVAATNTRSKSQLTATPTNPAAQEWRLQKMALSNPDSSLNATGVWSKPKPAEPAKVDVQFNWQLDNSGALLTRLGLPGLLKDGKGVLQGRVGWLGSPFDMHYPSLAGQLKLDISKGQFLKVDPGAGRLLSVISLQALPRLLTLDFRDLFSDGFAFDSIAGDAEMKEGVLSTQNLQMKSLLALVSINGSANIAKTTQNLNVLVLPDVNAGGASLIATLINPIVGAVTYLAQLVLRRPAVAASTKAYTIEGTWREPKVTEVLR